jgi:hypothetical protein
MMCLKSTNCTDLGVWHDPLMLGAINYVLQACVLWFFQEECSVRQNFVLLFIYLGIDTYQCKSSQGSSYSNLFLSDLIKPVFSFGPCACTLLYLYMFLCVVMIREVDAFCL